MKHLLLFVCGTERKEKNFFLTIDNGVELDTITNRPSHICQYLNIADISKLYDLDEGEYRVGYLTITGIIK